jgi:hypothetical protein
MIFLPCYLETALPLNHIPLVDNQNPRLYNVHNLRIERRQEDK